MLSGAAIAAPVAEEQRVPLDLRRTTLVVSDMENSLSFYRDALGMVVTYDNLLLTPKDASLKDAERATRLVFLRANDDFIGVLGLMEYLKPRKPVVEIKDKAFHTGTTVLVLNLEDQLGTFAKAREVEGTAVLSEPSQRHYPSYDGEGTISVLVSVVQDPDGFVVELNQLQEELH